MTTGRPKASSREVLAEAACELFLEQGYAATTVADITRRAGVSRSSFFNYFAAKGDVLWAGLDHRIDTCIEQLARAVTPQAVTAALQGIGDDFAPDSLALALVNATVMGVKEELARDAALRQARIALAVSEQLQHLGIGTLIADVAGAAHAGAVLSAISVWAVGGAQRASLATTVRTALVVAASTVPPQ